MEKFVTRPGLIGHVYHDGTQMVVINAGEDARVPERDVDLLEAEGIVGKQGDTAAPASKSPARPRAAAKASASDVSGDFTAGRFAVAKGKAIGSYAISGPGLDAPEQVRGKAKTQARLDELNKSSGAGSDAPAD